LGNENPPLSSEGGGVPALKMHPKMKYLVSLQFSSRHQRPDVGNFIYSTKHQRHIWKGKEYSDIGELSQAINEALDYSQTMDFLDLHIRVYPCEDVPVREATETPIEKREDPNEEVGKPSLFTVLGSEPTKRSPGRPRKYPLPTP